MPKCLLLTGLILLSPLTTLASFESDVITATNQERLEASSSVLIENSLLSQIAAARAARMAETQHFSHTDVDGHNAWYWIKEGGYSFTRAGENIAVNFSDASATVAKWMNSDGHRANILNKNFEEIGVGTAQGLYKGATSTYIVQLFGARNQEVVDERGQVLGEEEKKVVQTASAATSQSVSPVEKKVLPIPKISPLKQKPEPKKEIKKEPVPASSQASQTATVQTPSERHFFPKIFSSFINLLTFLW